MKKYIVAILISLTFLMPNRSYALFGVGDIVFDPTAFGQMLIDTATGAKELFFSGETYSLDFILNPLANQLAASILQRFQNDTIRWINNGFQGGGPAYILNPKAYFNNIANRAIEQQISGIQGSNNIFGNGIIGTVIQSARTGKAPTSAQLQYTLGTTVQKSMCTEANITELATQSVDGGLTVGNSSASRQAKINAQKNILYQQLCSTSAVRSTQQQQLLTNAFVNNFAAGGWSAWLDLSTNPNNTGYGATVRASQLVAESVASKQTAAKEELVNGLAPQKKCTKLMELTAADYEDNPLLTPENAPCLEEQVEVPAATVANSLQAVTDSGPNKIANSTTFGSVISSVLISSLTKLFSGKPSSGSGSALNSTVSSQLNVSQSNTGRYIIGNSQSPFNNGPATGGGISGTVASGAGLLNILTGLKTSLTTSQSLLDNIITMLSSYVGDLQTLNTCYNSIQNTNSQIDEGKQYVSGALSKYSGVLTNLTLDRNDIGPMIEKVDGFITYLRADSSLDAANSVAGQYSDAVSSGALFDKSKEAALQSQYDILSRAISDDRTSNLTPKLQQCRSMGGQ